MKVVVCQHAELRVEDVAAPTPAKGQVRLRVLRCGICGSDLHARHGADAWADLAARLGYDRFARSADRIVFGHEFCGEVLDYGPGTKPSVPAGTRVVALPVVRNGNSVDGTGLSLHAPGAYAEQLLVEQSMMLPVPNGLSSDVAALTEPMAVALHAVRRSEVGARDLAIVIGCGPVGLGVIMMLKAAGVKTVVASDYSPRRRALAKTCGADVVVDPATDSPYRAVTPKRQINDVPAAMKLFVDTKEKFDRLPGGGWNVWRLGEKLGAAPKRPVIFECVGVPGVIESIIDGAPLFARIVVVGVCVGVDRFIPAMAINKQLDMRFVLGYSPPEFRATLHMLAEGKVDPRPLITGTVGLEGVERAFAVLGDAELHAKILVDPSSNATL